MPTAKPDDRDAAQRSPSTDGKEDHICDATFPVVCLGASAGGLEAFRQFFQAMPSDHGMAFILIQHLDPTHDSMLAALLADVAAMPTVQAMNGMVLAVEHLYVIPPGVYLSIKNGALWLFEPPDRRGTRMPLDFFLRLLAEECRERAICCILSGSGTDGSLGLKAIKEFGGLVLAQSPDEAMFDGMPRSAVQTGCVDLVLPIAKMPEALLRYSGGNYHRLGGETEESDATDKATDKQTVFLRSSGESVQLLHAVTGGRGDDRNDRSLNIDDDSLSVIIFLLRRHTSYDFSLYKHGTLRRRIARRMAIAGFVDTGRYREALEQNLAEMDILAKDMLINVTHFFRDTAAFDVLEQQVIPQMVRNAPTGRPLRVWTSGCSTGEEAYSLAVLFLEAIAERPIKFQIFASDIDSEAVATAREGFYPESIEVDVSPFRLARFFSKEDLGYRVLPELRRVVVFTTHDMLVDPPFSRLDMIACRNLLIYLGAEAQKKALRLFHFALRENGVLFLGCSETIGAMEDGFIPIDKKQRLYRRICAHRAASEIDFPIRFGDSARLLLPRFPQPSVVRTVNPEELTKRLLLADFAPASVLIDCAFECLYFLGPTDRFLQVAEGEPNRNLLNMIRKGLRGKLYAAIRRANPSGGRGGGCEPIATPKTGGMIGNIGNDVHISDVHTFVSTVRTGDVASINYETVTVNAQLVHVDGGVFYLISFLEASSLSHAIPSSHVIERETEKKETDASAKTNSSRLSVVSAIRIAELERELEATRDELLDAVRNLEEMVENQKVLNEEAMSVNEEFLSTNEELETSKEELQSLNEELTTLNNQLQEMVERQRSATNDLQNILNSSDSATVFLDNHLNIRFFTPPAKALFGVISGDIGRPLADLARRFDDPHLLDDARKVLNDLAPLRQEVRGEDAGMYIRRILPYRTADNRIEGVVITFSDITDIKAAQRETERALAYAGRIIDTIRHPLVVFDQSLRVVSANPAFYRFFQHEAEETIGRRLSFPGDDDVNKTATKNVRNLIKKQN
ncbi:two-component system, chemotaxis family, CheB/CheR fusion protein [Azospirillaceae bacterium]